MVKLLDHFGRPIERSVLEAPQTAQMRTLHREFAGHPSRGLTPSRLARILRDAEQGDLTDQSDLFQDMEEKDAHIYAEMSKRRRAVLTLDWSVEPPRGATRQERDQAAYAQDLLRDVTNLEDVFLDALDAIGHGFACLEIEWQLLGREWLPKAICHRPQRWFMTSLDDQAELRLRDVGVGGAALQPFGWIVHVHQAKSGYLARSGLHRILAWPYLFKNFALQDLAEFLEIYGLPLRLGTYPSGASEKEKATLLRAVVGIGHDAAGIIPEGMGIEFKEAAKGQHDPYQCMLDWCERSQSKAILGGTLTSQADGRSSTNALGRVHNEIRQDLLVSDTRQLASTITRDLIYPLLMLNGRAADGMRRCPRLVFDVQAAEDFGVMAEAIPRLVDAGARIPLSYVNEKLKIPVPLDGEPILGRPQPTAQAAARSDSPSGAALAALKAQPEPAEFADQAALDKAMAELPGDALQAQIESLVRPVVELILAGGDPDEVADLLLEAHPKMDSSELEEMLARAWFVAEAWGRISAAQEADPGTNPGADAVRGS